MPAAQGGASDPRLLHDTAASKAVAQGSMRLPTDITEDVIRDVALPMHLVDVKVCSVDDIWSGLKLVIRVEHR
jgi:hypothetical protein